MTYALREQTLQWEPDGAEGAALLRFTNRLQERLEPRFARCLPVTAGARRQLMYFLLQQLCRMADDTFRHIKREYMQEENPLVAWDPQLATQEQRERASRRLRQALERTDCRVLFERAPMLETWFQRQMDRDFHFISQMLERITADAGAISQAFLSGRELGAITGISMDGADLHFHGCCTCIVSTQGGKFVYKPHNCHVDARTGQLVGKWFSDVLVVPGCLLRPGYGYTQFIENRPLEDRAAAQRYFYRLGGSFALFQALGSTDLHAENWRSQGEYPALVDLETILTPIPRIYADPSVCVDTQLREDDFLYDANCSLIPSSMLPQGIGKEQTSIFLATERPNSGSPVLDGKPISVIGFEGEALEGFSRIYDRCVSLKRELAEAVEAFRGVPVRRLIRNTNYYGRIWERLFSMSALQNQKAQEQVCDQLGRFFLSVGARQMLPIARWEKECLLEGDIPYFCALSEGRDLMGYDNVVIADFFQESGIENALNRISRLGAADKALEYQLMRQGFSTSLRKLPEGQGERPFSPAPPISDGRAREEAAAIFRRIEADAVTGPSGKTDWFLRREDGKALSAGRPTLFQGTAGLGVFLSAVAAVCEEPAGARARELAGVCADQIASYIRQLDRVHILREKYISAGLADGFGGVLRALQLMNRYLPELGCEPLCGAMVALLNRYEWEEARRTDVISGLSGLILSLSALPGEMGAAKVLRRAADRLLELRIPADSPHGGLWDTLGRKRPISGVGHGHAGIAAALMAAAEVLGDETYVAPALAALEFEHGIYSQKLGTWPDLRETALPMYAMHGLCSGAPGIGLALLRCQAAAERMGLELPTLQEDLDRAVAACMNPGKTLHRDHLCCGNGSAVEFLLEASVAIPAYSDPCRDAARSLLGKMVARKERFGGYTLLPPDYVQVEFPSLFYGTSGIGYELLRAADPTGIRPVLF